MMTCRAWFFWPNWSTVLRNSFTSVSSTCAPEMTHLNRLSKARTTRYPRRLAFGAMQNCRGRGGTKSRAWQRGIDRIYPSVPVEASRLHEPSQPLRRRSSLPSNPARANRYSGGMGSAPVS
jgi:hypothetical protein